MNRTDTLQRNDAPVKRKKKYSGQGHDKSPARLDDPSPSAMNWKGDGIDHINIGRQAVTDLGFGLSNSSPLDFDHSIFGNFCSMETFWHYIQSKERDDRIRGMKGPVLQKFVEMLTWNSVKNFRAIIMDAHYQRIKQYEALKAELTKSTLPFDCYTINTSGIRIRPKFFKWVIFGFEEIRAALRENREPNFDILKDIENSGIYDFVIPSTDHVNFDPSKTQRRSKRPFVKK